MTRIGNKRQNDEFRRGHLVDGNVYTPPAPDPSGEKDAAMKTVRLMQKKLHEINLARGMLTQGWMRSALFLRTVYRMKGGEGLDIIADAVWAYTSALIDNLGQVCGEGSILKDTPPDQRYETWRYMANTLKRGAEIQVRLLSEIKAKKVEYEACTAALEYGRKLLRTVHFPRGDGADLEAFAGMLAELGPEGIPDISTDEWKKAVRLAKAIMKYEGMLAADANAKPESAV